MNLDLLRDVRNVIAANPSGFSMRSWVKEHPCGTACCIAGHAYFLFVGREPSEAEGIRMQQSSLSTSHPISSKSAECLRISPEQGDSLFYAGQWPVSFRIGWIALEAPPRLEAAIELLDRLIDGRITLTEQGEWLGDLEYSPPAETQEEQTEECEALSVAHEEVLV